VLHRLRHRLYGLCVRGWCGEVEPAASYDDDSYASGAQSPDEAALVDHLAATVDRTARLLHVGVGGSHLARRLADRVAQIDGITVNDAEIRAATALALSNYRVWRLDKYSRAAARLPGPYTFIVDNNPGYFACCQRHFQQMMANWARLLAPGAELLTHARGAGWPRRGAITLDWPAWAAHGARLRLLPERRTPEIWALRRESDPLSPR
jgi:hypothetical protein